MRSPSSVVLIVLVLAWACAAHAEPPERPWTIAASAGVSVFLNSQSKVPSQLMKPTVRLGATIVASPGLRLGLELVAVPVVLDAYRLIGAYAVVEASLYDGSVYHLRAVAGAGVGTWPKILSQDLLTGAAATLWAQLGLRMDWRLHPLISLGLDLLSEHLSVVTLNGRLAFHF